MPSRFVQPTTTTLKISGGDTVTVKRRLTWGEQNDLMAKMAAPSAPGDGGVLRANPFEVRICTVIGYLVDWSLTDADGAHVDLRGKAEDEVRAILRDLEQDVMEELFLAISTHIAAQDKLREAEKNGQGTASGSPAISPSPDGATGAMSGLPS